MTTRRSFITRLLPPTLTWLALATGGHFAMAQTATSPKIAADLRAYVTAVSSGGSTAPVSWARNLKGQPHVKVLINASSTDSTLASLRQDILARGGSVLYNYISVRAVAAMVPTAALGPLAGRADVISVSPNRATARQGSLLQAGAGAGTALPALPTGSPLDGKGVGIAILDSGIDYRHQNFLGSDGNTRVRAVVDFVAIGRAASGDGWSKGQDFSPSAKESIDGSKYKQGLKKLAPSSDVPDAYGHGSHVAAVAAGSEAINPPTAAASRPRPTCTTSACWTSVGWAAWPTCWPASTG